MFPQNGGLFVVIRSIASEHKLRVPARATAIIRRSNEEVTAAAPGYSPMPTKADFSVAADARHGCDLMILRPSTKASLPTRIISPMLTNDQRSEGRHIVVTRRTRDRREFAVFGRFGRPCLGAGRFFETTWAAGD